MHKKIIYVVAVYVSVVGKDKRKLEDYNPDGLFLETEDYEKAKDFYNSLDLYEVIRDWLMPNEKNYCVKAEKEISRWIQPEWCFVVAEFDELLEFVETPWMRLENEEKSYVDLIALTEEERRYARV